VIVTVIAVAMMQAAVNQIIDVIAVRNRRVAATVVIADARDRLTSRRVLVADGDNMLVVVAVVRVM
jgi:hypothetical protein